MNLACIGTGDIVEHFLAACMLVEQINLKAVYTRTSENGEKLAKKFNIEKIYFSLSQMLENDDIDTVYIASPNSIHFGQAMQCIESKKNVIVEKPFCTNSTESKILFNSAKEARVFIFEAMSLLFLPNLDLLKRMIHRIEPITWIEASCIQYSRKFNAFKNGELPNVFNPEFSGGALMDINIYNINFVFELLGMPISANYIYQQHTNGIDLSGEFIMKYEHSFAMCTAAKDCYGKPHAFIHGQRGYIELPTGVNGLRKFSLISENEIETYDIDTEQNHFVYEIREFKRIIDEKNFTKADFLNSRTQDIMELITNARYKSALFFSMDKL